MSGHERIALCGGTFDPIHRGHVEPLLAVFDRMEWSRIVYVPAAQQPFKTGRVTAPARDRWAMAALATDGDPRLRLSAVELERGSVSYTVDTLAELRAGLPEAELEWVIGDDNFALLPEWRELERIFTMASFVVLRRGGGTVPESLRGRVAGRDGSGPGRIIELDNEPVAISATDIRRRIATGEPFDDLVAPAVARYIQKYGLYGFEERT